MSSLAPARVPAPAPLRVPARLLLLLLVGLLTVGLVLLGPAGEAHAAKKKSPGGSGARVAKINTGANIALKQLGDPYRYGASGPGAFDCSGLLYFSFRKAGLSLPRTSSAQYRHARKINKANLKRGDLMFFHSGGRVYHAAIFLGRKGGKVHMVHSPSTGKRVSKASPWTSSWYAATLRGR